jgi:short-subunit dehydrogenase
VPVYGANNSALRGLSEALFIELGTFGTKVETVFPKLHSTKIFTKLESATAPGRKPMLFVSATLCESLPNRVGAANPEQVAGLECSAG